MASGMDRRGFVFSLAALAFAPPAGLLRASRTEPAGLTREERDLLGAVCEQLVPTDEFPGARELGAVEFIERLLKEAHPEWMEVYRAGLRSLDSASRAAAGSAFGELPFEKQKEILVAVERGGLEAKDWPAEAQEAFFGMVLSHTMNGYYGHPQWGGNQGRKAWAMIGYDDWWA